MFTRWKHGVGDRVLAGLTALRTRNEIPTEATGHVEPALWLLYSSLGFILLYFVSLGFASASTLALNQLDHKSWTSREGAPPLIEAIGQTSDGMLWVGSASGLYQFDGAHFIPFTSRQGEPSISSQVASLQVARDNTIWVGLWVPGIARIQNGHVTIFGFKEGLILGSTRQIAEGPNGEIWAVVGGRLMYFARGRWAEDAFASELVGRDDVTRLFFDRTGVQWMTAGDSLYSRASPHEAFHREGHASPALNVFESGPDGRVWLQESVDGRFNPIREISPQIRRAPEPIALASTMSFFLIDSEGAFWFTSQTQGIVRVHAEMRTENSNRQLSRPTRFISEHMNHSDGMTSDSSESIFQDRDGNVWIGTTRGLDRFAKPQLVRFTAYYKPWREAISPGPHGVVWIADLNLLISTEYGLSKEYPTRSEIVALHCDNQGAVWFTDPSSLWKFADGKFVEIPYPKALVPYRAHQIVGTGDGNIYVLIIHDGVWLLSKGVWTKVSASGLPSSMATTISADDSGGLWIGYVDGQIGLIENGLGRSFAVGPEAGFGPIEVLVKNHLGVFAGGEGGVGALISGHFQPLLFRNKQLVRGISGIAESANGDLWLNGSHGVIHIARNEIEAAIQAPARVIEAEQVLLDGAPLGPAEITIGIPTATVDSNGKLWFANAGVVYSLEPSSFSSTREPPSVEISSILGDDTSYAPEAGVKLKRVNALRIGYFGIEPTFPERVRYRYKLDGAEDQWQDAGERREATYTKLGPGSYTFHAAATTDGRAWSESAPLIIKILPAYYQTVWFRTLLICTALGLLWAIYAWRIRFIANQIRERSDERASERVRIARDLHDTLLQGLHGLIFRLQAVHDLLPGRPIDAMRTLESALNRCDDVMAEGRGTVEDLRSSNVVNLDLQQALSALGGELLPDAPISGSTVFRVLVEGKPRGLEIMFRDEAYRIAREALRNAFYHAQAQKIEAEMTYGESEFVLRIRDDGIGIDAKYLDRGMRAGHWGLPGMRERAKRLGGQLEVWSEHEAGTEVELTVPASVAYGASSAHRRFWFVGK